MENRKTGIIPATVLEQIDALSWNDTTEAALIGLCIESVEDNGPNGVTLYGFYPLVSNQHYLIVCYPDDEIAGLSFQMAAV